MGPLRRVNPYYKRYYGRVKPFFTVVSLNVFIYHIDVISSYLKLRTSPFYRTGTCNYSFQLNSSFITAHSSDSFTLSVFRFSSCSAMARNCLGRPVHSFGRTLMLMCPLYAVQGCHLYRSILSMMLTMFQSLQSFPLHHFLSPKLSFFHKVSFSTVPDKILPAICTIYMPLSLASSR